jgi:alpha-tubulin suppressor-like RCC1 family protein
MSHEARFAVRHLPWLVLAIGCTPGSPGGSSGPNPLPSTSSALALAAPAATSSPAASMAPAARAARLAAGVAHACAWTEDGRAYCWGSDEQGQLGERAPDPGPPAAPSALASNGPFGIGSPGVGAIPGAKTCTSPLSPPVRCWHNAYSPRRIAVAAVDEIAPGRDHTCARLRGGTVSCWGRDASAGPETKAATVPGIGGAVQLVSGARHTCARLGDGTVRCWGDNDKGQLGDGTLEKRTAPARVKGLSGVIDIAAGVDLSCARLADETLRCWGWNTLAGGDNQHWKEQPEPAEVKGLGPVAGVTVGGGRVCAWSREGELRCWGHNTSGEIGDGSTEHRASPVRLDVGGPVAQAVAGGSHTCALRRDGKVLCWGRNHLAQTGQDAARETQPRPVEVPGLEGTTGLAAGGDFTCARTRGERVSCWGASFHGQAGRFEAHVPVPTEVAFRE